LQISEDYRHGRSKHENQGELLLFPTTIGDKTYLNVCDGKEPQQKLLEEKGWRPETVNAYLILRFAGPEGDPGQGLNMGRVVAAIGDAGQAPKQPPLY
jgi:hypothetical protein